MKSFWTVTPLRYGLSSALVAAAALSGCASTTNPVIANSTESLTQFTAPVARQPTEYEIAPLDTLAVTTFKEPDLSVPTLRVDSSGNISMPLIGSVRAAGLTSEQLSDALEARYEERYLVDPQVNVLVTASAPRRITVEGSVNQAGVYEIEGRSTLLQAVALARGPSDIASLRDVVVFRTSGDQQLAAVFDLQEIRRGAQPDPDILAGDTVVVGLSNVRRTYRDILQASPLLGAVFRPITG